MPGRASFAPLKRHDRAVPSGSMTSIDPLHRRGGFHIRPGTLPLPRHTGTGEHCSPLQRGRFTPFQRMYPGGPGRTARSPTSGLDEVLGLAQIDDVVGVPGQHVDGLDLVAGHLKLQHLVRCRCCAPESGRGRATTMKNSHLRVVPVLTLGDAGLRDVDAELAAVLGFEQLGKAAAGVLVLFQVEDDLLFRQIGQIRASTASWQSCPPESPAVTQRCGLSLEPFQQVRNFAQCDLMGHRRGTVAPTVTENRRQTVVIAAVRPYPPARRAFPPPGRQCTIAPARWRGH